MIFFLSIISFSISIFSVTEFTSLWKLLSVFFNLPKYVKSELKFNKITNIDLLNIDTFKHKNNFFSARRSLRLKHDDYGRNISIIMIN